MYAQRQIAAAAMESNRKRHLRTPSARFESLSVTKALTLSVDVHPPSPSAFEAGVSGTVLVALPLVHLLLCGRGRVAAPAPLVGLHSVEGIALATLAAPEHI